MLKKLLHEFVYGGHLLSLGASSITLFVMILVQSPISWNLFLFAYLVSQIVYNYDHLADIGKATKSTNPERTLHLQNTKNFQIASLIFYIALFFIIGLTTNLSTFILGAVITIGGILYTKKMKKLTKKILGFKNIYIALFWSALTFLIPLHYSYPIDRIYLVIALFIFVRWIINSAYFDIKDLEEDKEHGLKTLPAFFGLTKAITYLHYLNILSGLIIVVAVVFEILPTFSLGLLVLPLYSFYYLVKAKSLSDKQLRIISYFMVDGEYLFWPLVLLLSRSLFV